MLNVQVYMNLNDGQICSGEFRSREIKSAKANSRRRSKHEPATMEILLRGFESAALASRLELRGFGFAASALQVRGFEFAASASRLYLRDFGFGASVRPLRLRGFSFANGARQ